MLSLSYPGAMRLPWKIGAETVFFRFRLAFPDLNSISHAELELAGFRDGVTSNRAV
jgi:hypothetical protein